MAETRVHVLATGSELVSGSIVDTNSAHISRVLAQNGLGVSRHVTVGDDLEGLAALLKETAEQADVAVVTGGLGPTADDLSAEAAALAAGVPLDLDPEALAWIESVFKALGRAMSPSNRKQALFPRGAERLDNPVGTAPGFAMEIGRCRFFFMPGVPSEMRRMLSGEVLPRLRKLGAGAGAVYGTRCLTTTGAPESVAGERLSGLEAEAPGVTVGWRAAFPYIYVTLYGKAQDRETLDTALEKAAALAAERLGHWVVAREETTLAAVVENILRERGETLAVAESCTGGVLGHWLTEVPGSSDVFLFSGVAYANSVKTAVLGVREETLERHGAVSLETAREMARGARRVSGAAWGVSTTGIAGPSGGSAEKPVGTVCIGISGSGTEEARRFFFNYGDRGWRKQMFAMGALELLRRRLLGLPEPDWPEGPGRG